MSTTTTTTTTTTTPTISEIFAELPFFESYSQDSDCTCDLADPTPLALKRAASNLDDLEPTEDRVLVFGERRAFVRQYMLMAAYRRASRHAVFSGCGAAHFGYYFADELDWESRKDISFVTARRSRRGNLLPQLVDMDGIVHEPRQWRESIAHRFGQTTLAVVCGVDK